jgi:hypothetical protein
MVCCNGKLVKFHEFFYILKVLNLQRDFEGLNEIFKKSKSRELHVPFVDKVFAY